MNDGRLSESDERLLELVREGRVDAEIGVRLGLGTGEARERIAALAAKLAVNGKEGLRAWTPPEGLPAPAERLDAPADGPAEHHRRRRGFAIGGVVVAAAALLLAGAWIGRTTAPGPATSTSTAIPAVHLVPVTTAPSVAVPTEGYISGIRSLDLGQLFTVPFHPLDGVTTESQRDALAVVDLAAPGVV